MFYASFHDYGFQVSVVFCRGTRTQASLLEMHVVLAAFATNFLIHADANTI